MPAFGWILLAAVLYALFQVFVSRTAGKIDATLPGVIGNIVAVIVPLTIFIYLKFIKRAELFPTTTTGVVYSLLAGVAVALYGIALVKSFERADTALVIPVVFGGAIAVSTLISWVFFKEQVTLLQLVGIVLVVAGIGFIAAFKR